MQLTPHEIHIWTSQLTSTPEELAYYFNLLNPEEQARAKRFHFPIHQQRFTLARGFLRCLIGRYLGDQPETIEFAYSPQEKPSLANKYRSAIQFNLSHSADQVVFAFTLDYKIGVDIEKIAPEFNLDVAKRYYSEQEYRSLLQAPPEDHAKLFYLFWSRKEAIVKANGKGLHIPLTSFSVSPSLAEQTISLEDQTWSLFSLAINPGYASAVATNQKVHKLQQSVYNPKKDV